MEPERFTHVASHWAAEGKNSIEAPNIYPHNGWYFLFVNWDGCCNPVASTYNIRVGRSRNPTGPYVDRAGRPMAEGGGTLFLGREGRFIGPGHAGLLRWLEWGVRPRYLRVTADHHRHQRGRVALDLVLQQANGQFRSRPLLEATALFNADNLEPAKSARA